MGRATALSWTGKAFERCGLAVGHMTYRDSLRTAMELILQENPNALVLGQGISDHKAVFGSTLGLVEAFGPSRVIETPLSEDAVTGISVGLALTGMYPIMTHIRIDFALLAMNQLVNMAAKYRYMFGGKHQVPMLVRMVVGRNWGQGGQHSQSLQSLFAHIPGLTVVMPSDSQSALDYYRYAASCYSNPVIGIEHRLLYDLSFEVCQEASDGVAATPPWRSKIKRHGSDVTVVASSIMVLESLRAAEFVWDKMGISVEVIDIGALTDPDSDLISNSVLKTGALVTADTSWGPFGLNAEIARLVLESGAHLHMQHPSVGVALQHSTCPTTKSLEDLFYPSQRDMVSGIVQACTGEAPEAASLPVERSYRDFYAAFKGPF